MPKTEHEFEGSVTTREFRTAVGGDWLDSPAVPRGTRVFIRVPGFGAFHPASIVKEDSGVYIVAGKDANPQDEEEVDILHANGENGENSLLAKDEEGF